MNVKFRTTIGFARYREPRYGARERAGAAQSGAAFSPASALWLMVVVAAVLPSVYGAPDERGKSVVAEIVFATAAATAALAVAPLTVALERRRVGLLQFGVALLSTAAAAIHFAVIGEHFEEYVLFGIGFIGMGLAQLAWAPLVLVFLNRWVLGIGIALNLVIIALWIWTRTVGLPFGPSAGEPETIGLADALSVGFEAGVVIGSLALLMHRGRRVFEGAGMKLAMWLAVGFCIGLTTLGLLSAAGVAADVLPPAARSGVDPTRLAKSDGALSAPLTHRRTRP